jgi:DNA-binding beta-propeller fold protein YncE
MYFMPGGKYEPPKVKELFSFGERGSGPGKFQLIDAIVTDRSGNVYVGDKQGFIHKFSPSGKFMMKIGSQGSGKGQFWDEVKGLAIDSHDRLIAVDEYNERVNVFDLEGNYLASFGRKGTANGEFLDPSGVGVDENDNIYIVDTKTMVTQKFDRDFNFKKKFGGAGARYYDDMTYIDSKVYGDQPGEFNSAESIACFGDRVFLADENNSRVQVYDTTGVLVAIIGEEGIGKGKFYDQVEGISFDNEGNMYAVNEAKGKWGSVSIFNKNYEPVYQFQPYGYMVSPDGIRIDNVNNKIYVVDQGNWKVRVFDLNTVKGHFAK